MSFSTLKLATKRKAVCTVRGLQRRVLIPRYKTQLKPTIKNIGSPPAWCIQHVAMR